MLLPQIIRLMKSCSFWKMIPWRLGLVFVAVLSLLCWWLYLSITPPWITCKDGKRGTVTVHLTRDGKPWKGVAVNIESYSGPEDEVIITNSYGDATFEFSESEVRYIYLDGQKISRFLGADLVSLRSDGSVTYRGLVIQIAY